MTILIYIVVVLFGLVFGSFLNVCIDRLPAKKSLFSPPSHCDGCGRRLSAFEMLPVASYLLLGGKCRTCGAKIPIRVLAVELLTGLVFALSYWRFGLEPVFYITVFWCMVFILIIFIDMEHQLILNKITYPAAVIAIIILAIDTLFPDIGLLNNLRIFDHTNMIPVNSLVSGLLGGGIFFIFFTLVFIVNPRGLGMGDIKLAALIGLTTGFPLVFVAMFVGIVFGGVVAVFLILLRKKGRKDVIPYGVFLGVGPIVAMLWGAGIFSWYLG